MPSKQFDILAVDFDYTLVSAVVIVMAIVTYVLARLAKRMTVSAQWR